MSAAEPPDRMIAVVVKAVALLSELADGPTELGTNELARRTGVNPSTVSRLLATMATEEIVRRVPDTGRYRLGPRLIHFGNAALAGVDLRRAASPHLVAITAATGETATLSVPGGESAVTVDFVQSPSSVRSVAEVGRPSVSHATATGKLHLAYGGTPPVGPLRAYTPTTITDRAALAAEIEQVRRQGWAASHGEREQDLNAVAVPVLARGALVGLLAVQGPAGRFDEVAMTAAVKMLQEHAVELEQHV